LSDASVALVRLIDPEYESPKVLTSQGGAPSPTSSATGFDVYEVEPGSTPLRIAAVSTMVLKAEPGWRCPCAARLKRRCP
jgi:hypothetical protein